MFPKLKNIFRYDYIHLTLFILPFWLLVYLLVPVFQSPDEPGHFAAVQALAHNHYPKLPEVQSNPSSPEAISLGQIYRSQDMIFNQQNIAFPKRAGEIDTDDFTPTSVQAYHPPLYYFTATAFYKTASFFGLSDVNRYHFTRIASLPFYLVFLYSAFAVTKMIFAKRSAFFLTLALGLQPVLLMLAVNLNPETAAVTFAALTFYFCIRLLRQNNLRSLDFVILGALSGLTILSKLSGIIIVPIGLLLILFLLRVGVVEKFKRLAIYGLSVATFVIPYLLLNYSLYGHFFVNNFKFDITSERFGPYNMLTLTLRVIDDFKSSLVQIRGLFGWVDTPAPTVVGIFYLLLLFLFLLLGIYILIKNFRQEEGLIQKIAGLSAFQVIVTLGFFVIFSFYIQATFFRVGLLGRYFFVAALPAAILIFYAINKVYPMNKFPTAKVIFLASVWYYLVVVFFSLLPRYYV